MMKMRIVASFLLVVAMLSSCVNEELSTAPRLSVVGNQLVNEQGDTVQLRGISFGWHNWYSRFYNRESVKLHKEQWNADVVRIAIGVSPEDGFLNEPEKGYEAAYALIDAAIAEGIYVIVDWHCNLIHLEESKEFFTTVAHKYRGSSNVMYELFNSPVTYLWSDIKSYSEELISAIRKIDSEAIIIVNTPQWNQDLDIVARSPIEGYDNLMYSLHFYAASHGEELRTRVEEAYQSGLPIFVSSCGAMQANGDAPIDNDEWTKWIDWLDERMISWVAWSVSDKPKVCSFYLNTVSNAGSSEDGYLRRWGRMIRDELNRKKKDLFIRVVSDNHYIFRKGEALRFEIEMRANKPDRGTLTMNLLTDLDANVVATRTLEYDMKEGDVEIKEVVFEPLAAGVYVAELRSGNRLVWHLNIVVSPEDIMTAQTAEPDFKAFWDDALAELATVDPNVELTLDEEGVSHNLYSYTMNSVGGEIIRGYISFPKDTTRVYPVMLNYLSAYESSWKPNIWVGGDQIEMVVSLRGQGHNKSANTYGGYIDYGFQSKEDFYFRSAFLDAIQALNYASSLPCVDPERIFVQGGSQGGAVCFVLAALDDRVRAAAAAVPNMCDYVNQFKLASWPANVYGYTAYKLGDSQDKMYRRLSYFDMINMAPMIKCPFFLFIGLQDDICPARCCLSAYNLIKTEKKLFLNSLGGHGVDSYERDKARTEFFDRYR